MYITYTRFQDEHTKKEVWNAQFWIWLGYWSHLEALLLNTKPAWSSGGSAPRRQWRNRRKWRSGKPGACCCSYMWYLTILETGDPRTWTDSTEMRRPGEWVVHYYRSNKNNVNWEIRIFELISIMKHENYTVGWSYEDGKDILLSVKPQSHHQLDKNNESPYKVTGDQSFSQRSAAKCYRPILGIKTWKTSLQRTLMDRMKQLKDVGWRREEQVLEHPR